MEIYLFDGQQVVPIFDILHTNPVQCVPKPTSRNSIPYIAVYLKMLVWTISTLLLYGVSAFIPNAFTPYITDKDFTHQDLTEQGILLAVAEYFESKPAPGKSTPPTAGSLTGISNITARKLFDAYYGCK